MTYNARIVRRLRLFPSRKGAAGMSKHNRGQFSRAKRPKTKLGLPDLDHSKSAVLNSLRSPESKRGYAHAIEEFIQWYCSEPRLSFNKVVVTRYRIHLEDRHLAQSMDASRPCDGSLTRPPMQDC
jgi:hypothetical protein